MSYYQINIVKNKVKDIKMLNYINNIDHLYRHIQDNEFDCLGEIYSTEAVFSDSVYNCRMDILKCYKIDEDSYLVFVEGDIGRLSAGDIVNIERIIAVDLDNLDINYNKGGGLFEQ